MIALRPYSDQDAMAVMRHLDPHDRMEAELVRGAGTTHLALFADWRAMEPASVVSVCVVTDGTPFALLRLAHTGQAGVAQAALLARDHGRFRLPLARLAVTLRNTMPGWCTERGIRRIEARAWDRHPTAARLLRGIGFLPECFMPGFGADGHAVFRQFAWIDPTVTDRS